MLLLLVAFAVDWREKRRRGYVPTMDRPKGGGFFDRMTDASIQSIWVERKGRRHDGRSNYGDGGR